MIQIQPFFNNQCYRIFWIWKLNGLFETFTGFLSFGSRLPFMKERAESVDINLFSTYAIQHVKTKITQIQVVRQMSPPSAPERFLFYFIQINSRLCGVSA